MDTHLYFLNINAKSNGTGEDKAAPDMFSVFLLPISEETAELDGLIRLTLPSLIRIKYGPLPQTPAEIHPQVSTGKTSGLEFIFLLIPFWLLHLFI